MHIGSHDVSMQRQIENLPAFLSHICHIALHVRVYVRKEFKHAYFYRNYVCCYIVITNMITMSSFWRFSQKHPKKQANATLNTHTHTHTHVFINNTRHSANIHTRTQIFLQTAPSTCKEEAVVVYLGDAYLQRQTRFFGACNTLHSTQIPASPRKASEILKSA